MTSVRIQLSRRAGSRLEETSRAANGLPARKVDRTTPFGNQFRLGKNGGTPAQRQIVVDRYRAWLMSEQRDARYMRRRIRRELAGHNVACWCALGAAACHGDVILEVLNAHVGVHGLQNVIDGR